MTPRRIERWITMEEWRNGRIRINIKEVLIERASVQDRWGLKQAQVTPAFDTRHGNKDGCILHSANWKRIDPAQLY